MTKLRYMTSEEKKFWTPTVAGVVDEDILLQEGVYTPETVRHEIGHVKYPVEISDPMTPEYYVQYLFAELCASYFSLKKVPGDGAAREHIRFEKRWARDHGLTREMVSRIDKVARERVGYTGREVR